MAYTYTLQPAEAAATDTYIESDNTTTNYGTAATIRIGRSADVSPIYHRGLIKFDLSTIPKSFTVLSANLKLVVATDSASGTGTLYAHRCLRNWVESQATWAIYSTGNSWGTAGCAASGTDYYAVASGSVAIGASEAVGSTITIPLTASDITNWIAGSVANYGYILFTSGANNDLYYYDSSSSATASEYPILTVVGRNTNAASCFI